MHSAPTERRLAPQSHARVHRKRTAPRYNRRAMRAAPRILEAVLRCAVRPSTTARRAAAGLFALAALAGPLLACTTTLRAYPGDRPAQVATLEPAWLTGTEIDLLSIDGIALSGLQGRAELAPGRHEVRGVVIFRSTSRKAARRFSLAFRAEGAARYQIFAEMYDYGPRVWIADADMRTVAENDPGMAPPPPRGRSYTAISQRPPETAPAGNETPQPPSPQ
jgi:hypothetical protein